MGCSVMHRCFAVCFLRFYCLCNIVQTLVLALLGLYGNFRLSNGQGKNTIYGYCLCP